MTDLAALEARLARLEAESDIRRLKARYLNACDAKDAASVRACFTADAELDYAPMGKFDVDTMIAAFTAIAVESPITDSHQLHNGEIELLDADHATASWALSFATHDPRTGTFRLMHGRYEDEYIRTPQGWRISKSRHTPRLVADGTLTNGTLHAQLTQPGSDAS